MLKSHNKTLLETLGRNPVHPFPARMAPGIALEALGDSTKQLRVLDPMSGSGTVLAVARAKGHLAFGVDIDPLAVLMAKVWTKTIDKERVRSKAVEVLSRAKIYFDTLPVAAAYPSGADEETRSFVRYWFDPYARRQLASLSHVIQRIRDEEIKEFLWCAFSRLIITKSAGASRAMDLAHSRPHREFDTAPVKPFNRFIAAVDRVLANCVDQDGESKGPPAVVELGDARALPHATGSIDLVLTSPPYLNAIDYLRCSKFTLVWMGYSVGHVRFVRGASVGTETSTANARDSKWVAQMLKDLRLHTKLSARHLALLSQYAWDMGGAVGEAARVLKKKGKAVYVVGDSTVRGTFVRNSSIVERVAEIHGLQRVKLHTRALPTSRRYLPPPSKVGGLEKLDARMRHEVILVLQK